MASSNVYFKTEAEAKQAAVESLKKQTEIPDDLARSLSEKYIHIDRKNLADDPSLLRRSHARSYLSMGDPQ